MVEALGETRVTLRQLNSRCGPLTGATTPQIQSLLDFQGPAELAAPLAAHNCAAQLPAPAGASSWCVSTISIPTTTQPSSAARCSVYGGNRNLPFSIRNA